MEPTTTCQHRASVWAAAGHLFGLGFSNNMGYLGLCLREGTNLDSSFIIIYHYLGLTPIMNIPLFINPGLTLLDFDPDISNHREALRIQTSASQEL